MNTSIKHGDIVIVNLGSHNGTSLQEGVRPAVVVQNDTLNANSPTTIIAPLTSVLKKTEMPSHVVLGKRFNLLKDSMVLTEQFTAISQTSIIRTIGHSDDPKVLARIDQALISTLGISTFKEVST